MNLLQDLVIASRVCADHGVIDAYGHVSVRSAERPDRYWMSRAVAPELITEADLVELDLDSQATMEKPPALYNERFIHGEIYKLRPDVNAIVHTHSPAASALAAAKVPLVVAHMDATPLFEDMVFLPEWPGLPTADREGELISASLGTAHALLLAHHGLLTAGRSVQEACFLAVFMERMARLQLNAAAVGGVVPIDAVQARRARDFLRTDRIMNITFDAWVRKARQSRTGEK